MRDEKIFDILERAEDDSMDRLIDKCPEISDAELDKILAMSEKKYRVKKKGMGITMNKNVVNQNGTDFVEGVERSRRPAWLAPLSIAASVVLIAGIAIGSNALMKKNNRKSDNDHVVVPGVTVTTTIVNTSVDTTSVTVDTSVTETVIVSEQTTVTTTAEPEVTTTEISDEGFDINEIVGKWEYQVSDGTHKAGENPVYNGVITIYPSAIYEYTDVNGNVTEGTVRTGYEEIAGSQIPKVDFFENTIWSFGGYYNDNEINIGNGGLSRLVRVNETSSKRITSDDAYNAVNNYCHSAYAWTIPAGNPDFMFVTNGNETDTDYEIIFRSYTGAFVYFNVNKENGNCSIIEENPITKEKEISGSISIYDYLN